MKCVSCFNLPAANRANTEFLMYVYKVCSCRHVACFVLQPALLISTIKLKNFHFQNGLDWCICSFMCVCVFAVFPTLYLFLTLSLLFVSLFRCHFCSNQMYITLIAKFEYALFFRFFFFFFLFFFTISHMVLLFIQREEKTFFLVRLYVGRGNVFSINYKYFLSAVVLFSLKSTQWFCERTKINNDQRNVRECNSIMFVLISIEQPF